MQDVPCINLVAAGVGGHPECRLGRAVPMDCGGCAAYGPALEADERTRCEVWTRVMGYHRPVAAFNPGKQSEHRERLYFREQERGDE